MTPPFHALVAHGALGAALGLSTLVLLILTDARGFGDLIVSGVHPRETLLVLAFVFSTMFAVGSGLTAFLLLAVADAEPRRSSRIG